MFSISNVFKPALFRIISLNFELIWNDILWRNIANVRSPNQLRGLDFIRDNRLNKGLAFTVQERQALGILGLLAPDVKSQKLQLDICTLTVDRYKDDLDKYLYLVELNDINEKLFYSLVSSDVEKFMPLLYTPTVGLACQKFGYAYRRPKGLFITRYDKGHIRKVLSNWPDRDVRAICFTDGERILGLGDLGAQGMGIPIGKLSLYTIIGGVKPHHCLPITLDVGTNNEALLEDPLYIGIREKRITGPEYYEFVDEFMVECKKRFGQTILLQFEDFAMHSAAPLLAKYRNEYCTFNDDIQGTASVAVAGFLAATRITKKKISEEKILFLGAGSAATGIAGLLVLMMVESEGLSKKDAEDHIFMHDLHGVVTTKREAEIPDIAKPYAKDLPPEKELEKVVDMVKPTCIIGVSTAKGAFTPAILKKIAANTERPIVFALSNPTSKAECSAQEAYDNTEGRCVFASGSPFPPVQYNGKQYVTGQGNNSYIFPGLSHGIISVYATTIPEIMFLKAAEVCASLVKDEDLERGLIYPPLSDLRKVSVAIAVKIAHTAFEMGLATVSPKPPDLKEYILKNHTFDFKYNSYLPEYHEYPVSSFKVKDLKDLPEYIRRTGNDCIRSQVYIEITNLKYYELSYLF